LHFDRPRATPEPNVTHAPTTRTLAACFVLATLVALPARALQPGEEIRMDVSYLHLPSGEGSLSIGKPDNGTWPLVFQCQTGGFAGFFDLREKMTSWWDPELRLPSGSTVSAVERGVRSDDEARYDRGSLKATVTRSRKGKVKVRELDIPADALDLPSVFMHLRLQPLAVGERYSTPVLAGRDLFTLTAEVVREELLETRIGDVRALAVRVKTELKGKWNTKRDTWLWFSADERHIPLRISAEFAVGSLVAQITSYRPGGELAAR
jgi:hypothetical protein